MCKLLEREGFMWAQDTTRDLLAMSSIPGGYDELIKVVARGKDDKPSAYANGVQRWINKLADLRDLASINVKP
jgi:hypothetical protein